MFCLELWHITSVEENSFHVPRFVVVVTWLVAGGVTAPAPVGISARATVSVPRSVSVPISAAVTVILAIAILGAFFARGGLYQCGVKWWDGLERTEFVAIDRAIQINFEIVMQYHYLCQIGGAGAGDYCFVLDIRL